LTSFGILGTGFAAVQAVFDRASSNKNRSMSIGLVRAAISAIQVIGVPLAQ